MLRGASERSTPSTTRDPVEPRRGGFDISIRYIRNDPFLKRGIPVRRGAVPWANFSETAKRVAAPCGPDSLRHASGLGQLTEAQTKVEEGKRPAGVRVVNITIIINHSDGESYSPLRPVLGIVAALHGCRPGKLDRHAASSACWPCRTDVHAGSES